MNFDRFKFRVWDEKDKQYLDPDYYEGFYMSPDGVVHAGITEWNGICDKYQEIPPEQLIVEQCTGLKDKNGELIFEGDIVLGSWNTKLIVFWCQVSAEFRVKAVGGYDREIHYYTQTAGLQDGTIMCSNFEIIGNRHEMEKEK